MNDEGVFLLTWNEKKWSWPGGFREVIRKINNGESVTENWTVRNKSIKKGDIVYLMRTGSDQGLIAKGYVASDIYKYPHFDDSLAKKGIVTEHVDVDFTEALDYMNGRILSWDVLKSHFPDQKWTPQSSGISIRKEYIIGLEKMWNDYYNSDPSALKRYIVPISPDEEYESKNYEQEELLKDGFPDGLTEEKAISYEAHPESRVEDSDLIRRNGVIIYPRQPQKRANALLRSKFMCEYDNHHSTFISKGTEIPYLETHHLIPLEFWKSFDHSLDVEANIVCLCSNCHNEIHYGIDAERIIEKLFEQRKDELKSAGLQISKDDLLRMYDDSYVESQKKI